MEDSLDSPIFEDDRGIITRNKNKRKKYFTIFTKKGEIRGGEIHPHKQYCAVLSGKIKLTQKINNENKVKIINKNQIITINENVPHLFEFLEDTIIIEWWDGEFKAEYYEPYRKIIENRNK